MSAEAEREARRASAVAEAIEDIRRIEAEAGVNRDALEQIKQRLLTLAADRELFPAEDFPMPAEGNDRAYLLQEDPDGRFALYMSVGRTGIETPPHNHTTWAVIAGVQGQEHNLFFERVDDGAEPGRGQVRLRGEETVIPGTGVAMMPDDIHAIRRDGAPPTLHLHLYGLALDRLHERIAFDTKAGTYRHFPANFIEK